MFKYMENTRTFWFSHLSIELETEFKLVGSVLGLAIYNGVILDLHFPPVVYKKLLNGKPDFQVSYRHLTWLLGILQHAVLDLSDPFDLLRHVRGSCLLVHASVRHAACERLRGGCPNIRNNVTQQSLHQVCVPYKSRVSFLNTPLLLLPDAVQPPCSVIH